MKAWGRGADRRDRGSPLVTRGTRAIAGVGVEIQVETRKGSGEMSYWGGCLMCHRREPELVLMVLLSESGKGTWKQTSPAAQ